MNDGKWLCVIYNNDDLKSRQNERAIYVVKPLWFPNLKFLLLTSVRRAALRRWRRTSCCQGPWPFRGSVEWSLPADHRSWGRRFSRCRTFRTDYRYLASGYLGASGLKFITDTMAHWQKFLCQSDSSSFASFYISSSTRWYPYKESSPEIS